MKYQNITHFTKIDRKCFTAADASKASAQAPLHIQRGKKLLAAALTGCLLAGMIPTVAFAESNAPSADGKTVQVISDPAKVSKAIAQDYSEGDGLKAFDQMQIDPKSGEVSVNGEDKTLSEALDISEKKEQDLTSGTKKENKAEIESYLKKEEKAYTVKKESDGTLTVSAPYQMQRLIVTTDAKIKDTYGATQAVYYAGTGQYILNYDSQEATMKAYKKLASKFGKKNVYPDRPLFLAEAKDATAEAAATAKTTATATTTTAAKTTAKATTTTAARTKATKAAAVSAKTKSAATKAATTKTTAANDGALSWGTTYAGLEDLVATANADSTLNKTTIAIIDTGVRKTHKIFKERTISSKSKAFDSISPKSLKLPYSYADIDENEGHGTHVAGIIADGTSKQVELLVIRAFAVDANGMPTASFFDVANAISYAVDQGVSVINFSGGENLSNKKSDYTTQTEYDIAMAQYKAMEKILKSAWKKGIFVAVASGNGDKTSTADQLNISKQGAYPARSSYAYTVGAIDKKYKRAYYSYYGKQLDFVAPGSQIMSASFEDDNEYITKSGTSMAAPNIAALAVMIKVFHPDYKRASIARVLRQRSSLGDNGEHTNQLGWGSVRIDGVKQTALKKTQTITNLANSYTVYYKESDLVLNPKTKRDVGFSYASSKPSVASANAAGKVTANGLGAAILTVHVDSSSSYDYAEKNVTIKSTLRKVTLKKLTAKKKKLKITWTPAKIADGYQIRYARKKDMSDAVTVNVSGVAKKSKTIKKLKAKKKYYVQVRLYKKLKGVTYYGAWSKKLKKKTK